MNGQSSLPVAGIKTSPSSRPPIAGPGSYLYTSSSTLLGARSATGPAVTADKPSVRPVPPPTLPKYTNSFNAGGVRDRDRDGGIGGSYRLASLDRLAMRQRLIEQTANNGTANGLQQNGTADNKENTTTMSSTAVGLQSKRELFFKSESPSSPGVPPPQPPSLATSPNGQPPSTIPTATQPSSQALTSTAPVAAIKETLVKKAVASALENQENQDSNRMNNSSSAHRLPLSQHHHGPSGDHLPNNSTTQNDTKLPLHTKPDPPVRQDTLREKPKPKELDGYVGFANLPNQVYRKAVKKGFEFTLMVVGESGLGKSTLINSMFLSDVYSPDHPGPSQRLKKTVAVETSRVLLKENGVNLTLTVVDTPGFGDAVDNSKCWVPIIDFVESRYEEFLNAESRVTRRSLPDGRVHCCLYFVAPTGHGLKPLDVEFMQRLGDKVNIVPVIAKADTMTPEECAQFKKQILNEIARHKIKIYEFPDCDEKDGGGQEDEAEIKLLKQMRSKVPFAVVGANAIMVDGKEVRGRKYPWGVVEMENMEHCDFIALRNMVIRTHLQDLKDVTNSVHYENYRCRKLAGLGSDGKPSRISNKNPLAQMEEEKLEHDNKMKKMETEMEQVFEMKVREKRQKLRDSELELTKRHETTKKALEQQARDLDDRRKAFEQEKHQWEQQNGVSLDELRRRSLEANSKETVDGKKDKKKKGLF
ncbi:septin-7 isoform X2 [Ctenocephalides felis]|uniref:septin-7 isoform X2 n=1 Tax=Ctenocephalides felis TaxID=7515 RepID=UPI000E6E16CD|nr:septin-7 isoform X2 [Ctenocephalides felis]